MYLWYNKKITKIIPESTCVLSVAMKVAPITPYSCQIVRRHRLLSFAKLTKKGQKNILTKMWVYYNFQLFKKCTLPNGTTVRSRFLTNPTTFALENWASESTFAVLQCAMIKCHPFTRFCAAVVPHSTWNVVWKIHTSKTTKSQSRDKQGDFCRSFGPNILCNVFTNA